MSPHLQNFLVEMKTGVPLQDRIEYTSVTDFVTYHQCFQGNELRFINCLGSDLVNWTMSFMGLDDREQALKIASKIFQENIIYSVKKDTDRFEDGPFLYRFN